MKSLAFIIRHLSFGLVCACACLAFGFNEQAAAQRDPFYKPVIRTPKVKTGLGIPGQPTGKPAPPPIAPVAAPPIQDRIETYKAMRRKAMELGVPAPKPTTVLTVGEIQVTGIFRTPRGYAAMVQATPIQLSYTIYPGEKFYDGYLVAIEESRLVFQRTTRMSNGKEITSAENKALQLPGINEMAVPRVESATNANAPGSGSPVKTIPAVAVPSNAGASTNNQPAIPSEPVLTAENKTENSSKSVPSDKSKTALKRVEPRINGAKNKSTPAKTSIKPE